MPQDLAEDEWHHVLDTNPDDMAGVAASLASPASDFVTGAVIPVVGGFSIAM